MAVVGFSRRTRKLWKGLGGDGVAGSYLHGFD